MYIPTKWPHMEYDTDKTIKKKCSKKVFSEVLVQPPLDQCIYDIMHSTILYSTVLVISMNKHYWSGNATRNKYIYAISKKDS